MKRDIKKLNWPLAVPSFTVVDKLKIAYWLFKETQWTAGEWITQYEDMWAKYTGCPHVIMVSSGSTANELIALRRKWELEKNGLWPKNNKVLVPICTWISSISPWVNIGFEPVFTDIGDNLNMTFEQMEEALNKNLNIKTVFYTALLGYAGDVTKMVEVCKKRGVGFLMDNCEASFSEIRNDKTNERTHICNLVTSSTSIYFSHFTTSGTEGGLIFCKTKEESDWHRMMRSHGMTRNMPEKYHNPKVDHMFDFYLMGSNYRSSNLQAYMASLDFERSLTFIYSRQWFSALFRIQLQKSKFKNPHDFGGLFVPLSLPIIAKEKGLIEKVKTELETNGVQHRQIVSGSLAYQTAFRRYKLNPKDFPNADYVHHNGIYIGLHSGVTPRKIDILTDKLNAL